jgi:acyl-CoA thioesterase-1
MLSARAADEPAPVGAAPVPHPSFVPVEDVPGLPRVFLVGDSISMGYTLPVRALLRGRANVHRPAENGGDTGRGLRRLDAWLGSRHWDVIYFNFGLHDLKYLDAAGKYVPPEHGHQVTPLPQYEANLRELVGRLRRTGAHLIYATTTPVPSGTLGRVEHDERPYNEVALRVMRELGVAVDDLAAVVAKNPELQQPHNVHFTDAGYAQLAAHVAASIEQALPPPAQ